MNWWTVYAVVWATALAGGLVLTWAARAAGRHWGFVDRPYRERHKRHEREVSMLGGVALFLAWGLTVAAGYLAAPYLAKYLNVAVSDHLPGLAVALPQLLWISGGALAMLLLGLIDDWRPLSAMTKFSGQLLVAAVVAAMAVRITLFIHAPLVTWLITVLWILFIVNAINFFDNMDTLAAGTAAIAALFFLLVAILREQYFVAVLAAATCGSAGGFLFFNWPPASIFMGDAGSHFLGFMLAIIGAMTTFYSPLASPTPAPVFIPLLVLALPIFDTFAVVFIRFRQRQPVYLGDHRHISHRFVMMGLNRGTSVLLVHILTFTIGAGAVTLLWLPPAGVCIVLLQAVALLVLTSILHVTARKSDMSGAPENV